MAKILLVDDNNDFREMLGRVLGNAGHIVTHAANGNEAMRLVQDNAFEVVITDLIMPEKEGIETIMELRRKIPALKIIAMSGGGFNAPEIYLNLARKLGAVQTLVKPFSGTELLAAVASVLSSDGYFQPKNVQHSEEHKKS
jgi:DNA-binding response OmpR family regulator